MPLDQATVAVVDDFVHDRQRMLSSFLKFLRDPGIGAGDKVETVKETIAAVKQQAALAGIIIDA